MYVLLIYCLINDYSVSVFFFLMIPPTPRSSIFPYTTLFRSRIASGRSRTFLFVAVLLPLWSSYLIRVYIWRLILNEDADQRSEEHTSELQSHSDLVCRLLLEKKKKVEKIKTSVTIKQLNKNTDVCSINILPHK